MYVVFIRNIMFDINFIILRLQHHFAILSAIRATVVSIVFCRAGCVGSVLVLTKALT